MMRESYVQQQQSGKAPIQQAIPMTTDNDSIIQSNNTTRQQGLLRGNDNTSKHYYQIRRTCTHKTAILLNLVTCGAAVNIAVGQIVAMVMQTVGWLEMVVRIYEISWSIFVVLNECQVPNVIKESPLVQSYTWRGVLYTFIGILGVLMNDIGMSGYIQKNIDVSSSSYGSYSDNGSITIYIPTQEQALEWYIRVVSWSLVGFGALYFVLGVLRQKQRVDRDRDDYAMRIAELEQGNDSKTPCLCGVMT